MVTSLVYWWAQRSLGRGPIPASAVLVLSATALSCGASGNPQLASVARSGTHCEVDRDCCVVYDSCSVTAYVVGNESFESASAVGKASQGPYGCARCAQDPVLVQCMNNLCAVHNVSEGTGIAPDKLEPLAEARCGNPVLDLEEPVEPDISGLEPGKVPVSTGCGESITIDAADEAETGET